MELGEAEDSTVHIGPFSVTLDKLRHATCALLCDELFQH